MDEATQCKYMAQLRPITFKDTIYFTNNIGLVLRYVLLNSVQHASLSKLEDLLFLTSCNSVQYCCSNDLLIMFALLVTFTSR